MGFAAGIAGFIAKEFIKDIRRGAEQSLIDAMTPQAAFQAGRMAFSARDYTRALTLFGKAAPTHPPAMTNLAVMHWRGYGTRADIERAQAFLRRAAAAGDAKATQLLSQLSPQPQSQAQDEPEAAPRQDAPPLRGSFAWAVAELGLTEAQAGTRIFVNAAFRAAQDIHHPDKGGTTAKAQDISEARDILLAKLN
jgi:TPR repeat protein